MSFPFRISLSHFPFFNKQQQQQQIEIPKNNNNNNKKTTTTTTTTTTATTTTATERKKERKTQLDGERRTEREKERERERERERESVCVCVCVCACVCLCVNFFVCVRVCFYVRINSLHAAEALRLKTFYFCKSKTTVQERKQLKEKEKVRKKEMEKNGKKWKENGKKMERNGKKERKKEKSARQHSHKWLIKGRERKKKEKRNTARCVSINKQMLWDRQLVLGPLGIQWHGKEAVDLTQQQVDVAVGEAHSAVFPCRVVKFRQVVCTQRQRRTLTKMANLDVAGHSIQLEHDLGKILANQVVHHRFLVMLVVVAVEAVPIVDARVLVVAQRGRQTWLPCKLTRRGHVEQIAVPLGVHHPQRVVAEDRLVGVRSPGVDYYGEDVVVAVAQDGAKLPLLAAGLVLIAKSVDGRHKEAFELGAVEAVLRWTEGLRRRSSRLVFPVPLRR